MLQSGILFGFGTGAHLPDLSSEVDFFDVLHLGIFVILSPAFDARFYDKKTPPNLVDERAYAVKHFHSILDVFNQRFGILLEYDLVDHLYVFNRMLGEFAAAAVVFAKPVLESQDDRVDGVTYLIFRRRVEGILRVAHPEVFPYYSRCLEGHHKHFNWTGPKVQIFPRSDASETMFPTNLIGALKDLPSHEIYDSTPPQTPPAPTLPPVKRRDRGNTVDGADVDQTKKQRL